MKNLIFIFSVFLLNFVACSEAPQTNNLPVARKSTFVVSYIDKVKYTFQGYDSARKVLVTTQGDENFAKPLLMKYENLTEKDGIIAQYSYINDTVNDNVILLMITEKK